MQNILCAIGLKLYLLKIAFLAHNIEFLEFFADNNEFAKIQRGGVFWGKIGKFSTSQQFFVFSIYRENTFHKFI